MTRYRPNPDETHLPRHIDGANVDGSLVLGLPTYSAFGESGGVTVWDGENDVETFRCTAPLRTCDSPLASSDSRGLALGRPGRVGRRMSNGLARLAPVQPDLVRRALCAG